MNHYQLSFFLKMPDGAVRGGTQLFAAKCATDAILQLYCLPLPGALTGAVTWSLVGPRLAPPRGGLRRALSPALSLR